MDIDQQGDVIEPDRSTGQILLPSEAHPGIIHLLPYERPFFPGQAIPLIVHADTWLPTLKSVQKREHDVIGLVDIGTAIDTVRRVLSADERVLA